MKANHKKETCDGTFQFGRYLLDYMSEWEVATVQKYLNNVLDEINSEGLFSLGTPQIVLTPQDDGLRVGVFDKRDPTKELRFFVLPYKGEYHLSPVPTTTQEKDNAKIETTKTPGGSGTLF